jgi:hypothetical protein
MKPVAAIALPMILALPLMGAKCSGEASAKVECPPSAGCTKTGEIKGGWEFKQSNTTLENILVSSETFDAAQWKVTLGGSNVSVPAYGTVLLKLVDSSAGVTAASRNFGWYRSGSVLLLSNPREVNNWAIANAGTADSIFYETAPFLTSEGTGTNNLVMSDVYENEQLTYSAYSWRSESMCPKRLDRRGNQIIYCP